MSNWLIDRLIERSARERLLLGVMAGIVLPLGVAFGGILPLMEARSTAQATRSEAQALQTWVTERATELASLPTPTQNATAAGPPIGSAQLEQGLIAAGLRDAVSGLETRAEGVIELRFETVEFVALANWISETRRYWGYDITSFRIEAQDDPGLVFASFTLTPLVDIQPL